MKKALQHEEVAFLFEKDGQIHPEEISVEEMLAAVNRGIKGEWGEYSPMATVLRDLHGWICRYLEEGVTDDLLNELNSDLHDVRYHQYVVPADFFLPDGEEPQSVYVANMNIQYTPEAYAAKEFSKFITYGMLNRIRRCQLLGCENIYLGPPQSKWCSKACGSKFRVSMKRKRDSS